MRRLGAAIYDGGASVGGSGDTGWRRRLECGVVAWGRMWAWVVCEEDGRSVRRAMCVGLGRFCIIYQFWSTSKNPQMEFKTHLKPNTDRDLNL